MGRKRKSNSASGERRRRGQSGRRRITDQEEIPEAQSRKRSWRQRRQASARMAKMNDSGERQGSSRKGSAEHLVDKYSRRERKIEEQERKGSGEHKTRRGSGEHRRMGSGEYKRTGSGEYRRGSSARLQRVEEEVVINRWIKAGVLVIGLCITVLTGAVLMQEDRNSIDPKNKKAWAGQSKDNQQVGFDSTKGSQNSGNKGPKPKSRRHRKVALQVAGLVVDVDGRGINNASLRFVKIRSNLGRATVMQIGSIFKVNAEGQFKASLNDAGQLLEVKAPGFALRYVPLPTEDKDALKELNIVLVSAGKFEGRVVAAESGAPIQGALISGESATWRGQVKTDGDGQFTFPDVPEETLAMLVTAPGRVPAVIDGQTGQTVALLEGRAVRGRVQNAQGQVVANAEVAVFGSEHPGVPFVTKSDADGQFEVRGLDPNEEFLILARAQGLATTLEEPWHAAQEDDVAVTLKATGTVVVSGQDLSYLVLLPIMSQPGFDLADPQETAEGLEYPSLPVGVYELEREVVGVEPLLVAECKVQAGQTLRVQATETQTPEDPEGFDGEAISAEALDGRTSFTARVVDEQGQGLGGATVIAEMGLPNVHPQTFQTDASGQINIPRLSTHVLLSAELPGRLLLDLVDVKESMDDVVLVMVKPLSMKGQLRPGIEALVTLVDPQAGQPIRELNSRANGEFYMEGLLPGMYMLEVCAEGYQNTNIAVRLPLRDEVLTIQLVEGGHHHHLPGQGHGGN